MLIFTGKRLSMDLPMDMAMDLSMNIGDE